MKVRATIGPAGDDWRRAGAVNAGFYGQRRYVEGEVFTLSNPAHFNAAWMTVVDDSTPNTVRRHGAPKLGRTVEAIDWKNFRGWDT